MAVVVRIDARAMTGGGGEEVSKTFSKPEVTVGRAPENDLVLKEAQVSSRHARLKVAGPKNGGAPELFITDVGSANGTFLEEQRLTANVDTKILPGQRIVIGNYLVIMSIEEGKTESPDPDSTQSFQARSNEETAPRAKAPAKTSSKPSADIALEAKAKKKEIEKTSTKAKRRAEDKLFQQEIKLRATIHDLLIERLDLRRKDILALSEEELRKRAQEVIEQILVALRWEIPEGLNRERVIKQVLDEALGLGPLEELIADDSVSEIMVNSFDMIYAERNGVLALTDLRFSSEQAVLAAIERILAPIGRRVDESSPMVDARLKDGSRVNAVIRPLALRGPCITIRKFSKTPLTIDDLVRFGAVTRGMADFLKLAVESRLNIVISGGTGSGKTTLLNVISSFVPEGQRVITVEDAAELQLPREHLIPFETRPPNLEGKGAVTIRDLVRNALRMRPDRIIVGECRGAEALDMLQAMNTGHDGSMTTGHSNAPQDMISRLETMVLMAGLDLPVRAVREQIASAIDIVVQQTRFSCGTRKVTAITEVVGMDRDEGTVVLQDVFLFRQDGYGADGKIHGIHQATGYIPKFFRKLQERGLPVSADVFSPDKTG